MDKHEDLLSAYIAGLREVRNGETVPSVRDPLSKASNFGMSDRPSREVLGHSFAVEIPGNCIVSSRSMPIHLPYCFGLLAWTLSGRADVGSLQYYRPGARELSDDGHTLSGAFGHRLFGDGPSRDQLAAIVDRMKRDVSSRRTWASILSADDNFVSSREYPCAAGVQLFLRGGHLRWLTVMRAQQALTVLPYDAFLFMNLQSFVAGSIGVPVGQYMHFSGTFHIYESEVGAADQAVTTARGYRLPDLPNGAESVVGAMRRLIELEESVRTMAESEDYQALLALADSSESSAYVDVVRCSLVSFALRKIGRPFVPLAGRDGWSSLRELHLEPR